MHLTLCSALEEHQADAVTMDCMGLFKVHQLDANPCLSFFELLNQGLTAVCKADMDSVGTSLRMRCLTGRPRFVSDPIIDTSTQEVIYAHCVATNRVYGPEGKTRKYIIRSHAEDGKVASVQTLLPVGEIVTSARIFIGDRKLLLHSAKAYAMLTHLKHSAPSWRLNSTPRIYSTIGTRSCIV